MTDPSISERAFDSAEAALTSCLTGSCIASWRHESELGSTNDLARELAAQLEDRQLPFVILADRQTAGRGRGGNLWWSAPGSLTFSMVLSPARWEIEQAAWPLISIAVGGAIVEAVARMTGRSDVQLKWPNDVFVSGRKLCGILVETTTASPGRVVVGVGINVANSFREAPPDVSARAVSLADLESGITDRLLVLRGVVDQMESDFRALARSRGELLNRWRARCFLTGKLVSISTPASVTIGTCLGLEDDGSLLLQTEAGPCRCLAGVVEILSDPEPGNR
jgi:BirA family biotin operon repressor/biotin-[acetyl-CoA-carboxylase] ligase